MRRNDFTRARATKWAKVSILPRRHAHAATPSSNNNIIYRIYIYSTATIILSRRRRDKPPARGHTSETAFTPTPWEESMSSQYFAFSHNPAIPPYYIKTPHCMAPRRWRIHPSRCDVSHRRGQMKPDMAECLVRENVQFVQKSNSVINPLPTKVYDDAY